jgi:hypothetical protein
MRSERSARHLFPDRSPSEARRSLRSSTPLFETATLSGVDLHAYPTLAAKRAIAEPGAITLTSDLTWSATSPAPLSPTP